jgi:hypothetical protein
MQLTMTSEECTLLNRILTEYLSNLRAEIAATDKYDMRAELHKEEEMIRSILSRLEQNIQVAA